MENEMVDNLVEQVSAMSGAILYVLYGFLAVFVIFLILYIMGLVKFFKKCGKPGWAAIVPYYNMYVLNEISGLNWWWFLIYIAAILLVPSSASGDAFAISRIATLFVMANIGYNMAFKFGKKEDWGWVILSAIFGSLFYAVLGFFGKDKYDAEAVVSKNGFIKDNGSSKKTD